MLPIINFAIGLLLIIGIIATAIYYFGDEDIQRLSTFRRILKSIIIAITIIFAFIGMFIGIFIFVALVVYTIVNGIEVLKQLA